MKLETFFEKFDQFADAPNAVTSIRDLVLRLAMQGKLVEQRPKEQPASQCIRTASKALVDFTPIESKKVPFGWVALPLGCLIASNTGGGTPSKQNPSYWNGPIPWASVKDVQSEKYLISTIDSITEEGLNNSSSNLIPPNRLIVVTRMGLGKLAINTAPVAINQDLRAIEPTAALDLDFAYLLFKSLNLVGSGITVKGITMDKLHAMPVLLPPLAEQKRIVAKVDELMALCDRLEAQQQERDTRHAELVRASLARFADAPTPINLQFLFHTSYDIDPADLRRSILTLAVQGKLVPQDPNDEPAEELLRIAKGKQENLAAEERLRKRKPVTRLQRSQWPYEFPATWAFPCFDDLTVIVSGVTKGRKLAGRQTISLPYLRVANVQRGYLVLDVIKEIEVLAEDLERYRLLSGDVLMTEGGDWDKLGRAAIWNEEIVDCIHQNHVYRVRSADTDILLPRWIMLFANSPLGRYFFEDAAKQTTNLASINMTQLRGCPLPLPPRAEQHRVISKVDKLMTLVDELERQIVYSRTIARSLLEALVAELNAAGALSPEEPA